MPRRSLRLFTMAACVIAFLGLAAYTAKITQLYLVEEKIWFRPVGPELGEWGPEDLRREEVTLTTEDGVRLHGWYVPHPHPTAAVLLLHGSGGNLSMEVGVLKSLRDIVGVSTLIIDYRGYGKSQSAPMSEAGFVIDAEAGQKWLMEKTGLKANQIVLMGRSLGTALAIDLAARQGAAALVLQGSFPSLVDIAAHHYWWNPLTGWMRNRFDSIEKIARYDGPVLFSHGREDTVAPLALAERLYDRANPPKELILFDNAGHESAEPADYYERLRDFLQEHAATTSPKNSD